MLVLLPYCHRDISQARDLLHWCRELDPIPRHELLLVASSRISHADELELAAFGKEAFSKVTAIHQSIPNEQLWPRASNEMFKTACEWIKQQRAKSFLWLESDAIPLVSGWLDTLEAAYVAANKPWMGTIYDRPFRHLNGVAIWPSNFAQHNPYVLGATEIPFDCVRTELTLRLAHNTPLIQRMLADPQKNQSMSFPAQESLRQIRPGVVLFHGCKDSSLIERLREQRLPIQTKALSGKSFLWGRRRTVGRLLHVWTDYTPPDPDTIRRNSLARSTWTNQGWVECPIKDSQLPRMWNESGRSFPYIKDIFDLACEGADKNDVIVYTNADICVSSDCAQQVKSAMYRTDACYCHRRDFKRLDGSLSDTQIATGHDYCGSDIKAFRVRWWKKHWKTFPDMILGMELWDPCLWTLINRTNPQGKTLLHNLIYHERHSSFWERPENRYTLKAQKHCLKLGAQFLREYGDKDILTRAAVPPWYGLKCDLVILGLAHEAVMFPKLIENVKQTFNGLDWRAFICANRSGPARPYLHQWVNRSPDQVVLVEEPGGLSELRLATQRYQKMAQLRNAVLKAYRESGLEAGAVLWIDMDIWGFWDGVGKEVKKLLGRNSWDAVAVNGLRPIEKSHHDVQVEPIMLDGRKFVYFDWLAFESVDHYRVLWRSMGKPDWYSHGKVPPGTRFTRDPVAEPIAGKQVNSAFGPACFYRPEAIEDLWYDNETGQCEHQTFHSAMRAKGHDKIYISSDIIALYDK